MHIYTLKYDYNLPTTQQVNVPTNSTFLIGIKAVRNGVELDIDPSKITLIGPDGTLTADSAKTNGYVTFKMAVQDQPKSVMYGIDIEGDTIKDFKLLLNAYKSQVGDIDAGGPGTDIDVNSVKAKSVSVVDDAGELVAALSSDNEGNGLLVIDNIVFTGAELSATFEANQILEEIA